MKKNLPVSEKKNYKPPSPFPFRPYEYPPPPYFPGCSCLGTCKCKHQDKDFVTSDGEFVPFAQDFPVRPPRVCVWEHLSREDFKKLELNTYDKECVFSLFEKRFPLAAQGNGKDVTLELLYEVLRYARVNTFSVKKSAALVSMYYNTHNFFLSSLWRTPEETYNYFKECILLHTVQRPPKSTEILQPDESRNALRHFVNVYLRHLPLVAVACLPTYRLQMIWPSRPLSSPVPLDPQSGENLDEDNEQRQSRHPVRKKSSRLLRI